MATAIICLVLVVICVFGVRSTMKRIAYGCCGSGGEAEKRVKCRDTDLSHYPYHCILPVKGMSCANCEKRIENAFHRSDNYYVKADRKKKQVEIYMKQEIEEQELKQIINRALG
ncbi:MAG: heavy-metal-associated domain-containing protein [Enterocloster sp.]